MCQWKSILCFACHSCFLRTPPGGWKAEPGRGQSDRLYPGRRGPGRHGHGDSPPDRPDPEPASRPDPAAHGDYGITADSSPFNHRPYERFCCNTHRPTLWRRGSRKERVGCGVKIQNNWGVVLLSYALLSLYLSGRLWFWHDLWVATEFAARPHTDGIGKFGSHTLSATVYLSHFVPFNGLRCLWVKPLFRGKLLSILSALLHQTTAKTTL